MHSNCVTTFEINFGILSTVVLHYILMGVNWIGAATMKCRACK
jgi:hypothetical protein